MKKSATAVKREIAILFIGVLFVVVISWLLSLNPYDRIHPFLERWLPGFRGADFTVFGQDGQRWIVATAIGLIAIPPFLALGVIFTRRSLEHVAFHSHLIPLHAQRSSMSGE